MRPTTKGSLALPFVILTLLAAAAGLAGGCADATGEALQQDVAQLRQDLNSLTLAVHRARSDTAVSQIERHTREQAAASARQITAVASRLDGVAAELSRVSARLEEVSLRVETLSRQQAARPAPGPGPAATPGVIVGAPRGPSEGPATEQAYQTAYLDFTKGNFPLAVSGFREFVRRFPDSPLADKAQYWIGESYFSLARASADAGRAAEATKGLEQAVQEFRRVVLNYPRAEKVPTAIYKEALALLELKQTNLAQARLRYLLEHFPQSEEAPLAKERLANLPG